VAVRINRAEGGSLGQALNDGIHILRN